MDDEIARLNSLIAESGNADDDDGGSATPPAEAGADDGKPNTGAEEQQTEPPADKKVSGPTAARDVEQGETSVQEEKGESVQRTASQHTPEERKEYAWKSLRKQNQRLNQELSEMRKQIEALSKKPEAEKTASEFATDADYQKYLIDHQLEGLLSRRAEEEHKAQEATREEQSAQSAVYQKIRDTYSDPDEYKIYTEAMNAATAPDTEDHEGGHMYTLFNDNPESAKDLSSFCAKSPLGARIMFHFAMVPADCAAYAQLDDPVDRKVELRLLEKKLGALQAAGKLSMKKPSSVPSGSVQGNTVPATGSVPIMGKMGTGSGGNNEPSDDDILKDIRRMS